MNREIKFRAWDTKHKEMLNSRDQGYQGEVFKWLKEGQPLEVMQFTGLHDRNGREIYEGDVVELYNTSCYRYPVCWIGENAAFGMDCGNGRIEFIGDYNSGYLEVVGNVHENPGLRGKWVKGWACPECGWSFDV